MCVLCPSELELGVGGVGQPQNSRRSIWRHHGVPLLGLKGPPKNSSFNGFLPSQGPLLGRWAPEKTSQKLPTIRKKIPKHQLLVKRPSPRYLPGKYFG